MKKFLSIICSVLMLISLVHPTYAQEYQEHNVYYDATNISSNWSELDDYIKIHDNQFYLELPQNVRLSSDLYSKVKIHLSKINESIIKFDLQADEKTGRIYFPEQTVSTRAYGKNAVYFHWNYLEIYLDAGMVQNISSTGVAALWGIAGIFTPVLAAHPVITLSIGVIFSLVANAVISSKIKDGIILHLNFLGGGVTYVGKQ